MSLESLTGDIREAYGITVSDILIGKYSVTEIGNLIKTIIENKNVGTFYFPDALYDSQNVRNRKTLKNDSLKPSAVKLINYAKYNDLDFYKYRAIIPQNEMDNVWKPQTVNKAKTFDRLQHGNAPRIMKLERQGGRSGKLHLNGLIALPPGKYDPEHYQLLEYSDIETGVKQWLMYLSKTADCRLERDKQGKLLGPFEHAIDALGLWFIQTLKNRRNGVKRNPKPSWAVSRVVTC